MEKKFFIDWQSSKLDKAHLEALENNFTSEIIKSKLSSTSRGWARQHANIAGQLDKKTRKRSDMTSAKWVEKPFNPFSWDGLLTTDWGGLLDHHWPRSPKPTRGFLTMGRELVEELLDHLVVDTRISLSIHAIQRAPSSWFTPDDNHASCRSQNLDKTRFIH